MKHFNLFMIAVMAMCMLSCSNDDNNEVLKSSEKKILEFSYNGEKAVIDEAAKTVILSISENLQIDGNIVPDIKISDKASVSPGSGEIVNLTAPLLYTVTAEDGSKQDYTVSLKVLSKEAYITKFTIDGKEAILGISSTDPIILVLPYGADITKAVPEIELSTGATISPASGVETDFTNPITYTVTSEDGQKNMSYEITVVSLPFDFQVTSVSATKVRPKQYLDVYGVFNETRDRMGVFITEKLNPTEVRRECSIIEYSPERIRIRIPEGVSEGFVDLSVHYYTINEKIVYPEKIEVTNTVPQIKATYPSRLANNEELFIAGLNFESSKGSKAIVRFSPQTEGVAVVELSGDVTFIDGLGIIHLTDLSELVAGFYNFAVYIDGLQCDSPGSVDITNEFTRPVINSVNNINPSVGESITLTASKIGRGRVDFYVKVDGADIYYPIYRINYDDIIYSYEGAISTYVFNMPSIGSFTQFKMKITDAYGASSEFYPEVITLK